jgi:hypothetical protein
MMEGAAELAQTFLGEIVAPGAPSYDEVRKVFNALIDKRPALIARCRGMATSPMPSALPALADLRSPCAEAVTMSAGGQSSMTG